MKRSIASAASSDPFGMECAQILLPSISALSSNLYQGSSEDLIPDEQVGVQQILLKLQTP